MGPQSILSSALFPQYDEAEIPFKRWRADVSLNLDRPTDMHTVMMCAFGWTLDTTQLRNLSHTQRPDVDTLSPMAPEEVPHKCQLPFDCNNLRYARLKNKPTNQQKNPTLLTLTL